MQILSRNLTLVKPVPPHIKRREIPANLSIGVGLTNSTKDAVALRLQQLRQELPHVYGLNWYVWSKAFYESRNKINLLTAANQCGKSVSLIRKNIEWATNKKLWSTLWPNNPDPRQFWYFYPSDEVATIEFQKKWVPDLLPRGTMKKDNSYGWEEEYDKGDIQAIHFKSGVTIYFKSYGQKVQNLQTATVHMVSGDEEMPEDLVDELMARVSATYGYFNLVFTATMGLPLWYKAMECQGRGEETFKGAAKWQVSLYDCQVHTDGTVGHWPMERIKQREASCTTHNEILKRVMGRFVKDEGKKYASFTPELCVLPEKLPPDWKIYAGVDIGSGGASKHTSKGAVVVVASSPDFSRARVIRTWRGDFQETTAQDILVKFMEITKGLVVTQACYDYQSREFGIIASRSGMPFIPADKTRGTGEQTLNALFGSKSLTIDEGEYDNDKLVTELMTIPAGGKNRKFQDDLTDALRYTLQLVPWDFTKMGVPVLDGLGGLRQEDDYSAPPVHLGEKEYLAWEVRQRRGDMNRSQREEGWDEFYSDIDEWQSQLDGDI
jgi:phage terminase large subunit-like protein